MRAIAIALLIGLLALAAILIARRGTPIPQPIPTEPAKRARHERPKPAREPESAPNPAETNGPAERSQRSPEGFYIGKGGERVYINYGTPDPVLRSLLQSVMESSSDPNERGKQIYQRICGACHQKGGEGKEGVAPPLAGSEWVLAPGGGRLVRIVLNGLTGPLPVQGREWNLPMLPWRQNLDDEQVAAVLTYVRMELGGNRAGPIASELVAAARNEGRTTPETAGELLRISEQ